MPLLLLIPTKNKGTNLVKRKTSLLKKHLTVIPLLFGSIFLFAQHSELKYNVIQNNDVIGWLKLEKKDSINSSLIKSASEIKKRLVILFTIIEQQEVLFQNGIMAYSHVYRKVNDNIKVNKHTTHTGDHYLIKKENNTVPLMLENIAYNQLSLYFYEPVGIRKVYSDNYERYLNIEKTGNFYTLKFPDGNKNTYYYSNGVCTKVKVEQNLFTVEFILVK